MTVVQAPPIANAVIETDPKDNVLPGAKATTSWTAWFGSLVTGDTGTPWVPVATNLASTGTPTITGGFFQNQGITDFFIRIIPATNTSSVVGSTYFDLPFLVSYDDACLVGGLPGAIGFIDAVTKRCYPPTWTNNTSPITIRGRVISQ